MGRYVFRLPDVGEGTAEAEIAEWHVKAGDAIKEDQPLVSVMTDKATVDIESPVAGLVLSITGAPGEKLPVGSNLVVLEVEGEGNAGDTAPAPVSAAPAPAKPEAKPAEAKPEPVAAARAEAPPAAVQEVKPPPAPKPGFATRLRRFRRSGAGSGWPFGEARN
jgi:2-oxoisovalerate dehydrogenase E2 component (dihydrolipoyl transacylase)